MLFNEFGGLGRSCLSPCHAGAWHSMDQPGDPTKSQGRKGTRKSTSQVPEVYSEGNQQGGRWWASPRFIGWRKGTKWTG
jgi:hypothetical protein